MLDPRPKQLAFRVEIVTAIPLDGTDKLAVTVRTETDHLLTLRLTRPEMVEMMDLILADRPQERPGDPGERTPEERLTA